MFAALLLATLLNTQARAGAIAAWHFDETSGSIASAAVGAVNGSLTGNAAFAPSGISGGAVSMTTGGNGFVDMGNNFGLTGNSTFSLVAWFKLSSGDTNGYIPVGKHHATEVSGYFLGANNVNSNSGEVTGGGVFYQAYPNPVSTDLAINDGNWHQLVGVHDFANSQARLYIDGTLRGTTSYKTIGANSANFAVGGILNPAGSQMIGALSGLADEVSIWDDALTGSDVAYLYRNPGATSLIPEPTSLTLLAAAGLLILSHKRSRGERTICA